MGELFEKEQSELSFKECTMWRELFIKSQTKLKELSAHNTKLIAGIFLASPPGYLLKHGPQDLLDQLIEDVYDT